MKPFAQITCLLALVLLFLQPVMAQTDTSAAPPNTAQTAPATTTDTGTDSFSNYHPLVVHFPIVLLIVAASLAVVNLALRKQDYDNLVLALTIVGAAGAYVASELVHPHVLRTIDPAIRAILKEHDKYANLTLFTSIVASVLFLLYRTVLRKPWMNYLAVLVLVASATFVSLSGHEGAKLVHQKGVGVEGHMLRTGDTPPPPPGQGEEH